MWESGDYPLHYHDDYEMEIVTVGSGSQIMNGNTFELKEKDVFLLKPLDYHKIHSDKIGFAHIRVREELLPKWIVKRLSSFKNPSVFHLSDQEYESLMSILKILNHELENKESNTLDIKANLIELLFVMYLRLDKDNLANADDSVVSKVIYFLLRNNRFTEKVTLDEIAEYVGYSKFYTSSIFHKQYGTTIQEFIIIQRIEYAKKLILETNYSMTEIIMECGFSSTSNFYSKFVKYVGCSPLKFKQQNKHKNEG